MNDVRPEGRVTLGRIVGLFGVKGWVKVHSDTRPREGILRYSPWQLGLHGQWQEMRLAEGRAQGTGVIARLEGCDDRDRAQALIGAEIAVRAEQLPAPTRGEYYWAQLEGLRVVNLQGVELGTVSHLFETGSNDVLVVSGERERLIPFTKYAVHEVDLERRRIRVDWDPED
jgi:16S rRNA processing protein RimM